jgi:hypothetical protein
VRKIREAVENLDKSRLRELIGRESPELELMVEEVVKSRDRVKELELRLRREGVVKEVERYSKMEM